MSDTGFFGFLAALLFGALLAFAPRVDWSAVPPVGVMLFLAVALALVAVALVALRWAADRSLARPLAHPIC